MLVMRFSLPFIESLPILNFLFLPKVSETQIRSASRTRKLALERQWLAYLTSEFGEETLTQSGQFLKRDISTLSNGARKIWTLTQTHSEWKQKSVRYQMQINKPITKA